MTSFLLSPRFPKVRIVVVFFDPNPPDAMLFNFVSLVTAISSSLLSSMMAPTRLDPPPSLPESRPLQSAWHSWNRLTHNFSSSPPFWRRWGLSRSRCDLSKRGRPLDRDAFASCLALALSFSVPILSPVFCPIQSAGAISGGNFADFYLPSFKFFFFL